MKFDIRVLSAPVSTFVFFLFIVFYCNVISCRWHLKHVFPCIGHCHLHFGRSLTRQLTLFLAEVVVLVGLSWPRLGFTSAHFQKVHYFFTDVTFLVQTGHGLILCGLPPNLLPKLPLPLLPVNFSLGFPEGLFEVVSYFFLLYDQLTTCWRTRKSHCWLLNCRFCVISEWVIAGLVCIPSNCIDLAQDFKILSQQRAFLLRCARSSPSVSPTPRTTYKHLALYVVLTLSFGTIKFLNYCSDLFERNFY